MAQDRSSCSGGQDRSMGNYGGGRDGRVTYGGRDGVVDGHMRRRRKRMLRRQRPLCSQDMGAVSGEKLGTDDEFEAAEDHFVPPIN